MPVQLIAPAFLCGCFIKNLKGNRGCNKLYFKSLRAYIHGLKNQT